MAIVETNIVLRGVSGKIGDQLVLKHYKKSGRTVLSAKPTFGERRVFSAAQKSRQEAFREAVGYARRASKTEAIYGERARASGRTAYHIALADWLDAPEIEAVSLSTWSGQVGESIHVQAVDDVKVTRVTVVIRDEQDRVLEQGEARQASERKWVYTTTGEARGQARVVVTAMDLPGHTAEVTVGALRG